LLGLVLVALLALAIVASWKNPGVEGRIRVRQAYGLLDEGRYKLAVERLEETLLFYDEPEARLALSYAYLARRDFERAERQARLVVEAGRLDVLPAGWTQLGRVLQASGHPADALAAWNMALQAARPYRGIARIDADARSAMWNVAMFHWARGEFDAARDALQDLTAGDDTYGLSARVKLAQLLGPSDGDHALQLIESIPPPGPSPTPAAFNPRSRVPTTPDLRVPGLSEGLAAGRRDVLAGALRSALESANNTHAGEGQLERLVVWGNAYLLQGEPGLARLQLARAVSMDPESGEAHAQYGLALAGVGDVGGAVRELETATALDPRLPLPYNALARIYMQRGRWDDALREIDALQRLQSTSATPHLLRGEYHRLRGEYGRAEEALFQAAAIQKGLGAQPGEPDAQLTLALFYIDVVGEGCLKGLPAAQESVAAHPDHPDSLDAVGWAFALCGRPSEALPPLEEAVSRAPDNPRYRYHLGRAYAQSGREADAREQYTRVLDFDPGGSWTSLAVTELAKLP
jgi:tetratricopeptide (TPR) repeat protein